MPEQPSQPHGSCSPGVISEWSIRVCEECGRRAAPSCNLHPEAYIVSVRVVPKDIERFREDVGLEEGADS